MRSDIESILSGQQILTHPQNLVTVKLLKIIEVIPTGDHYKSSNQHQNTMYKEGNKKSLAENMQQ